MLTVGGLVGASQAFPARAAKPDEPLVLEAETTVPDATLQASLAAGNALAEKEDFLGAALKYNEVVTQGDATNPIAMEGQYALAVALEKLGLFESAFTRFEPIVDAGVTHPKYKDTLTHLLTIARATGSDPSVLLKISQYGPELYPAEAADELHFLVGQYFYGEESLNDALNRFQAVSAKNPEIYVRAKYLEGIIDVAQSGIGTEKTLNAEKLTAAADAFKTVLRTADKHSTKATDKVAADTKLALGRLFFSTRQYDIAIRYYEEITTDNPHWLEAVYEVAWVQFQLKSNGKALGHLETVNSPYFATQYFPESRVLQSLILFLNCRYDDADKIVADFVNDYYPLMNQFRAELNQFADPNAFYGWLARLGSIKDTEYSLRFQRIFNAALEDKKLRRKFEVVAALERETKKLDELSGKGAERGLLGSLKGDLAEYRSLVIGEAGSLAQARLLRVMKDLQRHLASALKIKGETLRARRGDISNAAAQEQAAARAAYRELEVDEEHIEWPFDGEYWKDELGFYYFDIRSQCGGESDTTPEPASP